METRTHHHVLGIAIISLSLFNVVVMGAYYVKNHARRTKTSVPEMVTPPPTFGTTDTSVATTTPLLATSTATTASPTFIPQKPDFKPVYLIHFGDAMFDRGLRKHIHDDPSLFASLHASGILEDYELRILDLEGPIIDTSRERCAQKESSYQFASDTARLLREQGITAVTIGNDHAGDCGENGIASTALKLEEANLGMAGYPDPTRNWFDATTKDSTKVAVIGVDATIKHPTLDTVPTTITKLKKTHDVVIVTAHWGTAYANRSNDSQKALAHAWIDAGADVIIGHHPHVVQEVENYRGRAIFYSLGDLIFDRSEEGQNTGMGVGMTLYSGSADFMLYPYTIVNDAPQVLTPAEANAWCTKYLGVMPHITGTGCAFSLATTK